MERFMALRIEMPLMNFEIEFATKYILDEWIQQSIVFFSIRNEWIEIALMPINQLDFSWIREPTQIH